MVLHLGSFFNLSKRITGNSQLLFFSYLYIHLNMVWPPTHFLYVFHVYIGSVQFGVRLIFRNAKKLWKMQKVNVVVLRQLPLFNFYYRNRSAFEKLQSIPSCLPPEGFFKLFHCVPSLLPTSASAADRKGGLKALLTTAQCEAFLFAGVSCWDLSLANCFVTVTNSSTAEAICNSMRESRSLI